MFKRYRLERIMDHVMRDVDAGKWSGNPKLNPLSLLRLVSESLVQAENAGGKVASVKWP